jgi:hypothetical protein
MQDMIGSDGMLRGWIALWNMQMLWVFATLVLAIATGAMIEVLVARVRRALPAALAVSEVPATAAPIPVPVATTWRR